MGCKQINMSEDDFLAYCNRLGYNEEEELFKALAQNNNKGGLKWHK